MVQIRDPALQRLLAVRWQNAAWALDQESSKEEEKICSLLDQALEGDMPLRPEWRRAL